MTWTQLRIEFANLGITDDVSLLGSVWPSITHGTPLMDVLSSICHWQPSRFPYQLRQKLEQHYISLYPNAKPREQAVKEYNDEFREWRNADIARADKRTSRATSFVNFHADRQFEKQSSKD